MPKRSRSGVVSRPVRVVAPTSVNGGRSRASVRAPASCMASSVPEPTTGTSKRGSCLGFATFTTVVPGPAIRPARTPQGALQWRLQGSFANRIRMVPSGRAPMPGAN